MMRIEIPIPAFIYKNCKKAWSYICSIIVQRYIFWKSLFLKNQNQIETKKNAAVQFFPVVIASEIFVSNCFLKTISNLSFNFFKNLNRREHSESMKTRLNSRMSVQ